MELAELDKRLELLLFRDMVVLLVVVREVVGMFSVASDDEFFLDNILGDFGPSMGEPEVLVEWLLSSFRSEIFDLTDLDDLAELDVSVRCV